MRKLLWIILILIPLIGEALANPWLPSRLITTPFVTTFNDLKSNPLGVVYSFDPNNMIHCTADGGTVNISEIDLAGVWKHGTLPAFLFDNLDVLKRTPDPLLDKLYFWADQRGHFVLSTSQDVTVTISCQWENVYGKN